MRSSVEPPLPDAARPQRVQPAKALRWNAAWVDRVGVVALCGLAVFTRLHDLGAESFWLDEATTFFRARLELPALFQNSVDKMHIPTYFVLIHYVLPFGDDEWTIRLPSALFGMLKPLLVAGAGYIVAGPRAAIGAGLLLIFSPLQLHYDQEARMYAIQTFGTCLALLGQVWLTVNREHAVHCFGRGVQGKVGKARLAWACLVFGTVLALYMHNTTGLFMLASSSAALVVIVADSRVRIRFLLHWVVANLLILLLWSPWMPHLFGQFHSERFGRRAWSQVPDISALGWLAREVLLGGRWLSLSLLVVVFALAGVWHLRRRGIILASLLVLCLLAPCMLWLVSLKKPMMLPRLILWSAPALYVLCGCGLAALRRTSVQWLILTALSAIGLVFLHRTYYSPMINPDWRAAAQLASEADQAGMVVLPYSFREHKPLSYYVSRHTQPIPIPTLEKVQVAVSNPERLRQFLDNARPERVVFLETLFARRKRGHARDILHKRAHLVRQVNLRRINVEYYEFRKAEPANAGEPG